jgi:predicted protein tyrosine phosphatase
MPVSLACSQSVGPGGSGQLRLAMSGSASALHVVTLPSCSTSLANDGAALNGLGEVIEGRLFVGAHRDVSDIAAVSQHGIRAYLCVAADVGMPAFLDPQDIESGRVAYLELAMADSAATRLADYLPRAFEFIDAMLAAEVPVAVYCHAGKSRSVSVVCAYLMRLFGTDFQSALEHVRQTRRAADPNIDFIMQLRDLDVATMLPLAAPTEEAAYAAFDETAPTS